MLVRTLDTIGLQDAMTTFITIIIQTISNIISMMDTHLSSSDHSTVGTFAIASGGSIETKKERWNMELLYTGYVARKSRYTILHSSSKQQNERRRRVIIHTISSPPVYQRRNTCQGDFCIQTSMFSCQKTVPIKMGWVRQINYSSLV